MKLTGFRVENFRSVVDSGWIATSDVTALIGTNEAGKTNLIVPLWKFNPAGAEGAINPLADYPRKRYGEIRDLKKKPRFITVEFTLRNWSVAKIVELAGCAPEEVRRVLVTRDLGGTYAVTFPDARQSQTVAADVLFNILVEARADIDGLTASKTEEDLKATMLSTIETSVEATREAGEHLAKADVSRVLAGLREVDTSKAIKRSTIEPRFGQLTDAVEELLADVSKPTPNENTSAKELITRWLPKFVYYSNYGNLDSEIYLPRVIEDMERDDLGAKEEAKVRTLRVLFSFVRLKPDEIWELGKEVSGPGGREPTEEQIKLSAEKKREREILLQSASSTLTAKFRDWWKQGDYRFRLQADGSHFRIWVSDSKRTEEIELESRSTGLQWFLSFYLVFLVESEDAHEGAVLLLDEAGLSLHPLAQTDLSAFFDGLAQTNQIIYTTHSPFLVDPDRLDRVNAVYVDDTGATVATPDLRAASDDPITRRSVFAAHAALGLSVSDVLFQGCNPIIVEGASDQYYLAAIKSVLLEQGLIKQGRELVFVPAGGVRGIAAVASIVSAKDEQLPFVILDADEAGRGLAGRLREGLYKGQESRIVLADSVTKLLDSEIEDVFPSEFFAAVATRYLPRPSGLAKEFQDVVNTGAPIVPQIEAFAAANDIALQKGWKVELAKLLRARVLAAPSSLNAYADRIEQWNELFQQFDREPSS